MSFRKLSLTAVAGFAFAASAVAATRIPVSPCQVCRAAYQQCMLDPTLECESEFSRCLIQAGCPLE